MFKFLSIFKSRHKWETEKSVNATVTLTNLLGISNEQEGVLAIQVCKLTGDRRATFQTVTGTRKVPLAFAERQIADFENCS